MKIDGVINKDLIACLTGLGHTDSFMICDAGFPIPKDAVRVDLALTAGEPDFMHCLNAILQEIVVEEFVIAENMAELKTNNFKYLQSIFSRQKKREVPQAEFVKMGAGVKFYVRTGDLTPYSNVILFAASGVKDYRQDYYIQGIS